MNCSFTIEVLNMRASFCESWEIGSTLAIFAIHLIVSNVLYRKWGLSCACIIAIWISANFLCVSIFCSKKLESSCVIILKFWDKTPNSSLCNTGIDVSSFPSCTCFIAWFIWLIGCVNEVVVFWATIIQTIKLSTARRPTIIYIRLIVDELSTFGWMIICLKPVFSIFWIVM